MIICRSFWGLRFDDNQVAPPVELRSGVAETSRKPRNQIHMLIYYAKKRESRSGMWRAVIELGLGKPDANPPNVARFCTRLRLHPSTFQTPAGRSTFSFGELGALPVRNVGQARRIAHRPAPAPVKNSWSFGPHSVIAEQ